MSNRRLYVGKNDVKNSYVFNTIKTAAENEITIGKILYEFTYSSLNLIIFHRGLYSKDSFSLRQRFGFQLPHINTPDVVNYIRTVTEKIVNFQLANLLEGFAFEECSRRTRERLVLKFDYHGAINLTPPSFEEFQENLEDLKISCRTLLFDLKRSLRTTEPLPSLLAKTGKVEKQRRRPRWKIVLGLNEQDGVGSTWDANKIGLFKFDSLWEVFPWKKSKVQKTIRNSTEESPLNEMARIISESDVSGDPVFYYDCQDLLNDDYYEEQNGSKTSTSSNGNEDDDIRPLFDDKEVDPPKGEPQSSNDDDVYWYDAVEVPPSLKRGPTSPSVVTNGKRLKKNEENSIVVVTIDGDDCDDNVSSSPVVVCTQADPSVSVDLNCGSPDMFEDPLEIFQDLEEKAAEEVATSNSKIKVNDKNDVSITVEKQVNTTPTSASNIENGKRASLKMFSVSSVLMIDTLMCNIILFNYPPRISIRKYDNENSNPFKKQIALKKRRVLVFD